MCVSVCVSVNNAVRCTLHIQNVIKPVRTTLVQMYIRSHHLARSLLNRALVIGLKSTKGEYDHYKLMLAGCSVTAAVV